MPKKERQILFIISNSTICTKLEMSLREKFGFGVEIANEKKKALEMLEKHPWKYDVAILYDDLEKSSNVLKTLKEIKNKYPGLEIVYIVNSDKSEKPFTIDAWKAGAFNCFFMPINYEGLSYAVKLAREQSQLRREQRMLEKLHRLSIAINSATDLQEIQNRTCQAAVELLNVDHSGLVLFEKDLSRGKVIAEYPSKEFNFIGEMIRVRGIPDEEELVFHKKVVNVPEISKHRGLGEVRSILGSLKIRSVLFVPVVLDGKVIASISLDSIKQERVFYSDEVELCKKLAGLVAVAIGKGKYLKELRVLHTIAREIGDTDPTNLDSMKILAQLKADAGKLLDVKNFYIALYDEEKKEYTFPYHDDEKEDLDSIINMEMDGSLTDLVRTTGKSLLVDKVMDRKLIEQGEVKMVGAPMSVWLGAPLIARGKVLGVMAVQNYENENAYDEHDLEVLGTIASQTAVAIDNYILFEDALRRIRDREIVDKVVRIMSSKLDPEEIFETIVSRIYEKLKCSHCVIFLPEERNGQIVLVPEKTHGLYPGETVSAAYKSDERLADWVFRNGHSVMLPDAGQDFHYVVGKEKNEASHSMLVVPMIVGTRPIGVISAVRSKCFPFRKSDRQLVESLALHAGIAIERSVGLNLLHEISIRLIRSEEKDEILKQIIAGAIQLTATTSGVIYLISDDGKTVLWNFFYPRDGDHPKPRLDNEQGFTREVIDSKRILVIENLAEDSRLNPALSTEIKALIGVPMEIEDKVVGVLFLHDKMSRSFTETECSLLKNLANQGAIAIEKANLVNELKQKNKELTVLNRIGRRVSAGNIKIKSIAKEVYYQTSTLVDINKFFLCIANKKGEKNVRLNFVVWCDNGKFLERKPMKVSGLTGWVFSNGESYLVRDWDKEVDFFPAKPCIVAGRQRSWLGVPMMIGKEVIGVISVQNEKPNAFNPDTVRLMEIIASQVAVAVRNAQLVRGIKREHKKQLKAFQKAISQISDAIATPMEPERMFISILKWAMSLTGRSNLGEIRMLDPETAELEVIAAHGVKIKKEYHKIPLGEGAVGWVGEHKEPLLIPDVSNETRYLPIHDGTKSEIVVPMMKGEKLIGVLNIENPRVNAFGANDLELAQSIAGLAVVAVENARLYKDLAQKIRDLESADMRLAEKQELLVRTTIAEDIVHHLKNRAGTIPIWTDIIRRELDPVLSKDRKISMNVDRINQDVQNLMKAVDRLKVPLNSTLQNINAILDKLSQQIKIRYAHDDNIRIRTEIAPGLYGVYSTYHNLSNIIWFIMINGIEAMPCGGTLSIRAGNVDKHGDRWVAIVVEDQGLGIAPENLGKIFTPSYSTRGEGRGYGLCRCKMIIEELGGKIDVKSKANEGTRFTISIPAYSAA